MVALETAVLTHGLPAPHNLKVVIDQIEVVAQTDAMAAVVGLVQGELVVGLTVEELRRLAETDAPAKVNLQNLAAHAAMGDTGGTTVSVTLFAAHRVGISVMATGGIGGVHRGNPHDVSADLPALAHYPMCVVCSGPKAILDIPATLENLESAAVPVLGYGTDWVPAFYSASSDCRATVRVDTPADASAVIRKQLDFDLSQSVLVCQPPPAEVAIPWSEVERAVSEAEVQAKQKRIVGREVTPYLLAFLATRLAGRTLDTNTALLVENARLAAQIAVELKAFRPDQ